MSLFVRSLLLDSWESVTVVMSLLLDSWESATVVRSLLLDSWESATVARPLFLCSWFVAALHVYPPSYRSPHQHGLHRAPGSGELPGQEER